MVRFPARWRCERLRREHPRAAFVSGQEAADVWLSKQALQNQARYQQGIRELFVASKLKGWEKDLRTLDSQLEAYAAWLRAEMLPRARASNRLPPEIYADNLKNFGVKADPRPGDEA